MPHCLPLLYRRHPTPQQDNGASKVTKVTLHQIFKTIEENAS